MWLLDVNVPKKLTGVLGEFGVPAQTAEARGWNGLTNGRLVEAAVEGGFSCLLTRDRLFSESAARALKRFPQLRGPEFLEQFRLAWDRGKVQPVPGRLLRWP